MKKIFIQVLSGAYNLGDELILRSEIDFFKSRFPGAQFFVATYDSKSFIGSDENIEFVSFFPNNIKKHPFKNIKYFFQNVVATMQSDVIVIGGGGIFFDNEPKISFRKNLFEWWLRVAIARIFRKKIVFFGISLEVKNPENQKKLKRIFTNADTILVRDRRSFDILKNLDINAEQIYDSVFLMPLNLRDFIKKPKTIGISLRGGFLSKKSEQAIIDLVKFLETQKYTIIFISHSFLWSESHNDILFIEKLFGKKYQITKTMHETLQAYKSIDIMIAMRLHAMILSAQHGIPFISISYGPKTDLIAWMLENTDNTISAEMVDFRKIQDIFWLLLHNYKNNQDKILASYSKNQVKFLQKLDKIVIL